MHRPAMTSRPPRENGTPFDEQPQVGDQLDACGIGTENLTYV